MFTKNFNSLSDSLIDATKKIMTESEKIYTLVGPDGTKVERSENSIRHMNHQHLGDDPIKSGQKHRITYNGKRTHEVVSEASNEEPNINHLELSEEELNELSPAALQAYKKASTERMKDTNVVGKELQKRQTGYSTATKKLSGDARVRAKEPENKSTTSTEPKSFGVKAGKITPKTPYNPSYSMIKEPPKERNYGASTIPQRAAASPMKEEPNEEVMPKGMSMKERTAFHMAAAAASKAGKSHFEFSGKKYPATMSKDVAVKMNEDSIDEALSPEARKRRDELKAAVRAAREKYRASKKPVASKNKPASSAPAMDKPEDPEESARKHPIDRLRRISLSMKGGHFEYDNGERHPISRDVARTIVKHYEVPSEQGGLKPYQKETLQKEITKSHDHMMKHYNKISGTNEDAYVPEKDHKKMLLEPEKTKKNKKELDEVPVETVKQVRMFNQNEESRKDKLIKYARDAMKKTKKEEQTVLPNAKYAKKVQVPEEVNERQMTDAEMKKREKIVMRLKDKMTGFKERYGKRAKDVMYATATKMAMKEETPKDKTMTGQKANPVEVNPSAPTKEGIGIKSTTT